MVVGVEQLSDLFLLLHVIRETGLVNGRTRLQKTIYLLREHYQIPSGFHFKPYFYGPYSDDLADAVENLVALGLIDEGRRYLNEDVIEYSYKLTKRGIDFLGVHASGNSTRRPSFGAGLAKAIRELNSFSTSALVATAKSALALSPSST